MAASSIIQDGSQTPVSVTDTRKQPRHVVEIKTQNPKHKFSLGSPIKLQDTLWTVALLKRIGITSSAAWYLHLEPQHCHLMAVL